MKQIDCFSLNIKFWKILGVWPGHIGWPHYKYYSKIFIGVFLIFYVFLLSLNFFYLPRQLDIFVEEMLFYFTELAVTSKILTFLQLRDKIMKILTTIESDTFQPDTEDGFKIIQKAKKFNTRYWKIIAAISITSNVTHVSAPMIAHILLPIDLEFPVCSYSFIPEYYQKKFVYPIYFYQSFGMNCHMLYNVNIDTFILGVMILAIAQLDLLDLKLRNLTNGISGEVVNDEGELVKKFNREIVHYGEIADFCGLIQDCFSATLFVQFSMASCIICTCLFRFTLPAPISYYVFLATYMLVMIGQIMVPCWFGTRIMDKSCTLSTAIYSSDWTSRTKGFKSSMRIFVERLKRPVSIIGGKMFPLSLETFTSIMNSAYSFFTLLRHMQSRDT
uniref:Odorant receptor n=1 Tax=Heortia vitessoides TaxID=1557813 RepID=A0A978W725_9NEOP|nr:odorant receptor 28 [Heortia vitessoides]